MRKRARENAQRLEHRETAGSGELSGTARVQQGTWVFSLSVALNQKKKERERELSKTRRHFYEDFCLGLQSYEELNT